jgi:glycosyltransferase involved in cell wall biosynthesis
MNNRAVRSIWFFWFALTEGVSWKKRHGRYPRLPEIAQLVQKAVCKFTVASRGRTRRTKRLEIPIDPYQAWLQANSWSNRSQAVLIEQLDRLTEQGPKLSILMPVHDPPVEFLEKAFVSVRGQVYQNWELCIADDGSSDQRVRELLQEWLATDSRVKLTRMDQSVNISLATNAAAELATGEFLLFLDHDDELSPDALGEVVLYLSRCPQTDILYSDDDKIDAAGNRYAPQFKPDWSPELLLSYMYLSHLFVVKRTLFEAIGGARKGLEGSQDYDLALRATEQAEQVGHVPKVLYHWRALPGSTASSGIAKPKSFEAGQRAVEEACMRRGIEAVVYRPDFAVRDHLGMYRLRFPDNGPSVTIVIPTKNQAPLLRRCLESIKRTTYRNYEVVIIDNESDDSETLAYLGSLPHRVLRLPNPSGRFNFAAINNRAVREIHSDYLLFLNNDTEVQSACWLSQMVGYGQIEGVGAVGAKLVFPDGRIQHAGVIHGLHHGLAAPAFKLAPADGHGYLSYLSVSRNYSAVTAACLLTPRKLFLDLSGFNEADYAVAYNDVDYCYRLVDRRYRCVYCPDAELIHYEGYSRGFRDDPAELAAFRTAYRHRRDPWYSPHLTLEGDSFQVIPRRLTHERARQIPVLMTAYNLNLEGAPYSQYELTLELMKRKIIRPTVFSPEDGPLRRLYEGSEIPVIVDRHPLWGVTNLAEYEEAIREFSHRCLQWGAEVVYGNTLQSFYAVDAAAHIGLPSVWNPRESEPWETYFDYLPDEVTERALRCFRYPYRVVFVSDASRDAYLPLNTRHNFTVIHNGLDQRKIETQLRGWTRPAARSFVKALDREVVVLLLGTVCSRKGQQDLVLAFKELSETTQQQVRCMIVGDRPGEYSQQLHDLVNRLPGSLRKRIDVVPETQQTAPYYRAADVFVCTSRVESYPRVILEAMAYGLPIVTTPVFGIREQVWEGANALFYTPGNSHELSEKLESLIVDQELRVRMAARSADVLNLRNDFDEMVQAYGGVLEEAWLAGGIRA